MFVYLTLTLLSVTWEWQGAAVILWIVASIGLLALSSHISPQQHCNTATVAHCANCHHTSSLRKQPVFGLTISYCQYGEMCQGMSWKCSELTEQSLPDVYKPPFELQWEWKLLVIPKDNNRSEMIPCYQFLVFQIFTASISTGEMCPSNLPQLLPLHWLSIFIFILESFYFH